MPVTRLRDTDIDGFHVRVSRVGARTTFLVEGVSQEIEIRPRQDSREDRESYRSGDAEFDAMFAVDGRPLACQALLDARTRARWIASQQQLPGMSVSGGRVIWNASVAPERVDDVVRTMLDAAIALEGTDASLPALSLERGGCGSRSSRAGGPGSADSPQGRAILRPRGGRRAGNAFE